MELVFPFITLKGIVTLLIIGGAIYGFVREKVPPDVVALLAIIALLLTGVLALGLALAKTGVTSLLAKGLAAMTENTGPYLILACFFLVALGISEFMSNSGTVALLGPVVISSAEQIGINPMALLVAVCFGASAAFAMPMGYQTNLMIYGPGGYRFKDFVRMGMALDILLAALALWLIPRFWPLA